eukprot:129113-Pleurochrysis_carterae.AAC.1
MPMPLAGGADLNGTASDDPTALRLDRPYRASPTGLQLPHDGKLVSSVFPQPPSEIQFHAHIIKKISLPGRTHFAISAADCEIAS